ncbi:MAG: hypothetical protein JXA30_21380 [Deltaproteobacteria bacterium]|nr:hypothetical protein [Deltaproteobacteria bacterium]
MNDFVRSKIIIAMNYLLAGLTATAAGAGVFVPGTYSRETLSWATQGQGQDVVTLLVVVPALVVSFILAKKGSPKALFFWLGVVFYLVYSYIFYTLALHFNIFFLLYCAVLGLSVYTLVYAISLIDLEKVKSWFREDAGVKAPAVYIIVVALLFYALWLKEVVPATLTGKTPPSIIDAGLLVNPVHVLDLSLVLPAFLVVGFSLLKRRPFAFAFLPMMMSFAVFMSAAIVGMMVAMKLRDVSADISIGIIFSVFTVLNLIMLTLFLSGMKNEIGTSGLP